MRFEPDDQVWLRPQTIGAPAICWSQPQVTVVTASRPYVIVRLIDNTEVRIHEDNVTRTQPRPPAPATPKAQPRPAVARGGQEVPLW